MPTVKKPKNKPTLVAFLLDRSGSMTQCLDETIIGFNTYLKELKTKDTGKMRFTLTQFDSVSVDVVHDAVPLSKVKPLNEENFAPRSFTPLYDAIGKTIRATEAKATGKYKVLFVTLTDGQENASKEWKKDTINSLIKEKEEKAAWTFAYIGVGKEGWAASVILSAGTFSASNILRSTYKTTPKAYARLAGATAAYACSTGNVSCSGQNMWGPDASTDKEEDPA